RLPGQPLEHVDAARARLDLLERDDIGVDLLQYLEDALLVETPVAPDAAVDVVRGDAQPGHGLGVRPSHQCPNAASEASASPARPTSQKLRREGSAIAAVTWSPRTVVASMPGIIPRT